MLHLQWDFSFNLSKKISIESVTRCWKNQWQDYFMHFTPYDKSMSWFVELLRLWHRAKLRMFKTKNKFVHLEGVWTACTIVLCTQQSQCLSVLLQAMFVYVIASGNPPTLMRRNPFFVGTILQLACADTCHDSNTTVCHAGYTYKKNNHPKFC